MIDLLQFSTFILRRSVAFGLVICLTTSFSFAQDDLQFRGSLLIDRTVYNMDTEMAEGENELRLDINPARMRLTSDGDITISRSLASLKTRTIYLRNDKDDILFITRPREAVQLTRNGLNQISGLMQQFGSVIGSQGQTAEVIRTGETEYVMGQLCEKIIVRRAERDEETFVWVTKSLNINWGILKDIPSSMGFSLTELLDTAWLDSGSFPMLAITFRGGKMRARAEVIDIARDDPESIDIDIDRGVQTISLSDYIFSTMWRR